MYKKTTHSQIMSNKMKSVISYISFVFVIVALYGFAFSFGQTEPEGKKVFVDSKCGMCHTVKSEGLESKKKDAVDLSTVGDTYEVDALKKILTKKEKIKDADHKVAFKGDEKSLDALSLWLVSLKSKDAPKTEEKK